MDGPKTGLWPEGDLQRALTRGGRFLVQPRGSGQIAKGWAFGSGSLAGATRRRTQRSVGARRLIGAGRCTGYRRARRAGRRSDALPRTRGPPPAVQSPGPHGLHSSEGPATQESRVVRACGNPFHRRRRPASGGPAGPRPHAPPGSSPVLRAPRPSRPGQRSQSPCDSRGPRRRS